MQENEYRSSYDNCANLLTVKDHCNALLQIQEVISEVWGDFNTPRKARQFLDIQADRLYAVNESLLAKFNPEYIDPDTLFIRAETLHAINSAITQFNEDLREYLNWRQERENGHSSDNEIE